MCDLFGLSCNEEDRATKSLPIFQKKFGTHETNHHGWGIAYFDNNGLVIEKASDGSEFAAAGNEEFRKTVDKARSKNIIAHLRTASGETDVCELNCHPFEYHYHERKWIFAHNGFVTSDFDRHPDAKGTTDSETIFHKMMGYVDEHMRRDSIRGLYPAIKKAIRQILNDYPGIKLNFLMSDGNMYYVFSHYYSQPPCNAYRPKPMYIQRNMKGYGNAILISTQDFGDGNWEKIPDDSLIVLNCGEIIVRSDPI